LDAHQRQHLSVWQHGADRCQMGAILIAQRPVQQQIADAVNAQRRQLLCQFRADAGQAGAGIGGAQGATRCTHAGWSSTRMASASMAAPLGNAATPSAARAGNGASKKRSMTLLTAAKLSMSIM